MKRQNQLEFVEVINQNVQPLNFKCQHANFMNGRLLIWSNYCVRPHDNRYHKRVIWKQLSPFHWNMTQWLVTNCGRIYCWLSGSPFLCSHKARLSELHDGHVEYYRRAGGTLPSLSHYLKATDCPSHNILPQTGAREHLGNNINSHNTYKRSMWNDEVYWLRYDSYWQLGHISWQISKWNMDHCVWPFEICLLLNALTVGFWQTHMNGWFVQTAKNVTAGVTNESVSYKLQCSIPPLVCYWSLKLRISLAESNEMTADGNHDTCSWRCHGINNDTESAQCFLFVKNIIKWRKRFNIVWVKSKVCLRVTYGAVCYA